MAPIPKNAEPAVIRPTVCQFRQPIRRDPVARRHLPHKRSLIMT
jgi:hypothetical protein